MKYERSKYQICSKHYSVNDVMNMVEFEGLEVKSIELYDREINQTIVYDGFSHLCFYNDKCEKFNPEEIDVDYNNFESVIYKGKFPERLNDFKTPNEIREEKSSSQLNS